MDDGNRLRLAVSSPEPRPLGQEEPTHPSCRPPAAGPAIATSDLAHVLMNRQEMFMCSEAVDGTR
jgi:hypothetical protein